MPPTTEGPSVGLFVTCLVDVMRPSVGFAAVKLLEDAGCRVGVPLAQTCCGQPAYNAGDRDDAVAVARQVIDLFADFDYVVAPSGSCAAMIAKHYPDLLASDPIHGPRALALAAKTHELTGFLVDVLGVSSLPSTHAGTVAYQDGCAAMREMGVRDQPRQLLKSLDGLELRELGEPETCCGFGGLFCVKYSDISVEMATRKADDIIATGAPTVTGVDLGCLLNTAGRLSRQGSDVEVRHIAELLAGDPAGPAIGR